jgi:hypothetical protein
MNKIFLGDNLQELDPISAPSDTVDVDWRRLDEAARMPLEE